MPGATVPRSRAVRSATHGPPRPRPRADHEGQGRQDGVDVERSAFARTARVARGAAAEPENLRGTTFRLLSETLSATAPRRGELMEVGA